MGESASPGVRYHVMDAPEAPAEALSLPQVHRTYWAPTEGSEVEDFCRNPALCLEGGAKHMIKWNYRTMRIALVLGAIAAFAVSSGAQTKWG
jgi:hypothetical protein